MSKIGSMNTLTTRRRLQFSLREVLFLAAVTFFGMLLIVPVNFRDVQPLGCAAVAIATSAAGLIAFSCTSIRSRWRKWILLLSIAVAWYGLLYQSAIVSFI